MKNSCLLGFIAMLVWAGAAPARQMPNPPPSGIVVHLFGPGSVTSNILPKAPAPSSSGPEAGGGYVEPSMGEVLHQMFVTGDPDAKPGAALAPGRRGNN